jgi:hypothetical protein
MKPVLAYVAATVLLSGAARAVELRQLAVDFDGEVYSVESEVWFDAPRSAVYAVFSDWDLSQQFSGAIVEAHDIGPDAEGRRGYYVRNRGCFLFFCKSVERRGSVEAVPGEDLVARADPAESDFRLCEEHWAFSSRDGGTLVRYTLRMTPDFWVPPLIGPYVIKRKLGNDGIEALQRIERLAQQQASVDE